jgi:hypothetical protein
MAKFLQLALWNANGLIQHTEELKTFTSIHNIHNIYETIHKPIWTYWIQLWGKASTSNIEILECYQSKALRMIVDAPCYVPTAVIGRDLQTPTVKEEIRRYSSQYSARLSAHPNDLIVTHGATRQQQAIAKPPGKWTAYQIPSAIVVFVILVFGRYSSLAD